MQLERVDVRADRQRAARSELGQERPLDLDLATRLRVVDAGERGGDVAVVGATLDRDASLADGRHELGRIEDLGDPVGQIEDLEGGHGHHDRAVDRDLRQPGLDVAAQLLEPQIGARPADLAPPPNRPGGDGRAGRHVDRGGQPTSASAAVRRSQKAASTQTLLGCRPQVLGRVHRQVGAPVEHRLLDLLDEHALATDRVEGHVLARVTARLDERQLDVEPGLAECGGDEFGLGCRLGAPAGGESQRPHRAGGQLNRGRTGRPRRRRCVRPAACRPAA